MASKKRCLVCAVIATILVPALIVVAYCFVKRMRSMSINYPPVDEGSCSESEGANDSKADKNGPRYTTDRDFV